MSKHFDLTLRVGGEGGEGVISSGQLTALGFARLGMSVYTMMSVPPEIKGGPAIFQLRISDGVVLSQGDLADFLLCYNQEAWELSGHWLKPGGTVIYDPGECVIPEDNHAGRVIAVPLGKIAKEEVGAFLTKNVVAIGVMAAFAGLPMANTEELVRQKWGKKKAEVLENNLKALALGYKYVHDNIPETEELRLPAITKDADTLIMSGNEALSFGALCAGIKCFFGYPITPASEIMEWLAKRLPSFGGTVVQTEDEIAAITACIGAGFAGVKAATSSAGPGISLMVEALGLAGMEEIPLVVFDAQRAGPSTGMPTKTEQGDLNLAVHGAHGDIPRIVLAPRDAESCFYTSMDAFNLAEKYQTPVMVLSDQSLAHRTQTIPKMDLDTLNVQTRRRPAPWHVEAEQITHHLTQPIEPPTGSGEKVSAAGEHPHRYMRYELTEDSISPMAIPGLDPYTYVATGLEHNEHAHIDQTPMGHTVMSDKRWKKIEGAAKEPGYTNVYGDEDAEIGIICWGSVAGPSEEAVGILAERGTKLKVLYLRMIWPLREREIREFIGNINTVIVPELNHSGQFAQMLKVRLYGDDAPTIVQFNKVTGLPFGAYELADFVEHVLGKKERVVGRM